MGVTTSAFARHFNFEFRAGLRNKNLLLMNYLFPLGFYLLMGFIMPGINPFFQDVMIPSMVTFAVLAATLLGLPYPLVTAREAGVFRSYKVNGVPTLPILVIPALTTAIHLGLTAIVIVATAPLLFDASMPVNWVNFGIVISALGLACTGFGVLIGVVSPSTRMTVLYSQMFFVPSMMLSGMMMPLGMLPDGIRKLAMLLPATHAMNAFNGLSMGTTADFTPWGGVIILALSGMMALVLALYLFRWDNWTRRRSWPGLLVLLPYVVGVLAL